MEQFVGFIYVPSMFILTLFMGKGNSNIYRESSIVETMNNYENKTGMS